MARSLRIPALPGLYSGSAGGHRRDHLPIVMIGIVCVASAIILGLVLMLIWLSFYETLDDILDFSFNFSLANYVSVLTDPFNLEVLIDTLFFAIIAVLVAGFFGVPSAWLAERTDMPGKTALFTFMTIGLLIPGFTVAMGWVFLMSERIGIINHMLKNLFGLSEAPFNIATIVGMGFVEGLALAPLTFVMTAALFRSMDPALEEASYASGSNVLQTFRRVTLPLIWPGIMAAAIYTFIIGFAAFDIPAIIGWSNRIYTFSTILYIFVNSDSELPHYGYAAAMGAIMIPLAILLSWWYTRMQRNVARYQVITGKGYRPRLIKLGRGVYIAWGFLFLYLCLGQVVPMLALVWSSMLSFFQQPSLRALKFISWRNYEELPWELIATGAKNTAILVVLAPTIVLALSLAFSWVVLRSRIRRRAIFDFFAFLPHAVPNIIFAIGLLLVSLFVLKDFVPMYGTIWLILLGFVIVRLSYGTRMMNGALIQVHRELEEASYISGSRTWGVFRTVLVPLLTPAMMYAWLWIALLSYRELTMATVLGGPDSHTLSVVVFGLWAVGGMGASSALTVIVVLCLAPLLALYWYISRKANVIREEHGA